MSHLFTLCRGAHIQKRSKPCCTTGRTFPSTLSLVWGPVDDPSQSLPSSHNACPPVVVVQITPPVYPTLRHYLGGLPQPYHRHLSPWELRGPTHCMYSHKIYSYGSGCPLTCERKRYTADFPRAIIGLRDDVVFTAQE